jgi:vancomycin resistance protein YoaR
VLNWVAENVTPPSATRFVLLAATALFVGGSYFPLRTRLLPPGVVLPGLTIDGSVPDGELRAFVVGRVEALQARRVQLVFPGDKPKNYVLSLGELGVTVDVARICERAQRVGHTEDILGRVELARRARQGGIDVPLSPVIDSRVALAALETLKEAEDTSPVSARLDLDHHTVTPERDGRYIDADAVIARLVEVASAPGDPAGATPQIDLAVSNFRPRITSEFVNAIDIHTVLSSFDTYFSRSGDQARRARNIEVGASKLDGLVLSPGELISFNQIVGERSEENGFQKSWEIFKGEMIEGVGGGTCQVASTMHAISFFGGLDILERLPHSRPSAYIPMGLDATVVYPAVDMKLRNPHPFPVIVHAKVDGNRLHMELLGKSKPRSVEFQRELTKSVPYARKIVEEPKLHGKHVLVKQHGIRGFRVKRTREIVFRDGHTRLETTKDFYPPTTEIYEVPPGFDVSLLPPLPIESEDEGEGSDASAQDAAAAAALGNTPASPPSASPVVCTGDCATPVALPSDLKVADAPGAHAPTLAQAKPPKQVKIRR